MRLREPAAVPVAVLVAALVAALVASSRRRPGSG